MYRKIAATISAAIIILLVTACAPLMMTTPSDHEIHDSPADLVSFDSLDAFVAAIYQNKQDSSTDIANLAELDVYYVASGLPNGFDLEKIIAGASDIMFLYYPSDTLIAEKDGLSSETPFELIFRRWDLEDPLSGIMEQIGQNTSDLIDEKYLYDSSNRTIYWVERESDVLSLSVPVAIDFSGGEIEALCSVVQYNVSNLETVIIEGDPSFSIDVPEEQLALDAGVALQAPDDNCDLSFEIPVNSADTNEVIK